jgi:hypothetical protein
VENKQIDWYNTIFTNSAMDSEQIRLYRDYTIESRLTNKTILCHVVSQEDRKVYCGALDALLALIEEYVENEFATEKGQAQLRIAFVQFKTDAIDGEYVRCAGPNIYVLPKEAKLELLGEVDIDLRVFVPLLIVNHHFFNHHETAQVENSLDRFWSWTLEQEMTTLVETFKPSPWACGVTLASMMAKTNLNTFGSFVSGIGVRIGDGTASYAFYKIQGPMLVLFGLDGGSKFVEDQLKQMSRLVHEKDIAFILHADHEEVCVPEWLVKEWSVSKKFSHGWVLRTRAPLVSSNGRIRISNQK